MREAGEDVSRAHLNSDRARTWLRHLLAVRFRMSLQPQRERGRADPDRGQHEPDLVIQAEAGTVVGGDCDGGGGDSLGEQLPVGVPQVVHPVGIGVLSPPQRAGEVDDPGSVNIGHGHQVAIGIKHASDPSFRRW